MRADVARDKERSDRVNQDIKRICGEHLLSESPLEEDMRHNTDLMVLTPRGGAGFRIACRVRDHSYGLRYHDEFTIRAERPNGAQTELAKLISGWGDWFFYGFANPNWDGLAGWVIGDLAVFRLWFNSEIVRTFKVPGVEQANRDGSSTFRAFSLADMPPRFVIARSAFRTTTTSSGLYAKGHHAPFIQGRG